MPKPTAQVDYSRCRPKHCADGRCPAAKACKHRVLRQEAQGEPPYPMALCLGCASCVAACPQKAIRLS